MKLRDIPTNSRGIVEDTSIGTGRAASLLASACYDCATWFGLTKSGRSSCEAKADGELCAVCDITVKARDFAALS